jgi:hypothetical protein
MSTSYLVNGRPLESGTELTVEGLGRVVFLSYAKSASGAETIDVITSRGFARTVRPDRIKTVHRTRRLAVR